MFTTKQAADKVVDGADITVGTQPPVDNLPPINVGEVDWRLSNRVESG